MYNIFIGVCLTVMLIMDTCLCRQSENESVSMNESPFSEGSHSFSTFIISSRLPDYMKDVDDLTFRIPAYDKTSTLPTLIIEPGFFSSTTRLDDLQNLYASYGFLVIGVNNKSHFNLITTSLQPYRDALLQTVRYVVDSQRDKRHDLYGLIDTAAIGISGHSMGGGGTILACNAVSDPYSRYIKAAIAMNPFGKCAGESIRAPILLIASELDSLTNPFMPGVSTSPEDIYASYLSIPANTAKCFALFKGMGHNGIIDRTPLFKTSGKISFYFPTMVSWFKVYLSNDTSYSCYIDMAEQEFAKIKGRFTNKGSIPAYTCTLRE